MPSPRLQGLILDFAGVLTTNMVEVIDMFEARERIKPGTFLRAWAGAGRELFRRLELGEIGQQDWNVGYGQLMGVDPENLIGRYLTDMFPAYEVIKVARQSRAAGVTTGVLSNSLGRVPFDVYAPYNLFETFDDVVLSHEVGMRKPDPAIYLLALDRLGLRPDQCVFVDDTEENLTAAADLGMTPLFSLDEREVARRIRMVFGLP